MTNLCHEIDKKNIPENYGLKMENYLKKIHNDPSTEPNSTIWNVSSRSFSEIFKISNKNYYSNETFIFMNSKILFTYKKSTYYEELIERLLDYNYVIGFGQYEKYEDLSSEMNNISELLKKNITIDICKDIQNELKSINFENYVIKQDEYEFLELKKILKGTQNYSNKKLIIIQSNYTNLYNVIYQFPEDIIISKSDPVQEIVCKIKKCDIEHINILKSYFLEEIKKFNDPNAYSIEFRKRLKNFYETKKNLIESYNSHKIISEFKKEMFDIKIDGYQIVFNIYNIDED